MDSGAASRAREIKQETEAVEKQTLAFSELADQKKKAAQAQGADFSGDIASNLGGLSGAAGALQLPVIGDILAVGQGFADIGQFAPLLASQVSTLGLATAAAIPGIAGAAAGVGVLVAAVIPIALIVGAAAIAIHNYSKEMEAQRAVLASVLDAQKQVRLDIAEGLTSEDAESRLAELTRLREVETETLGQAQGAYNQLTSELKDSLGIFSGPVLTGLQVFDSREQELVDSITEGNTAIQTIDAEIAALERTLANGGLAANDATASIEELKQAETELAAERAQSTQELTASLDRISGFNQQIADMSAQRALAEINAAELATLETRFALEDETAETQAHYSNLAAIASDGRAKIASIQSEITNLATEQNQAIQTIQSKGDLRIQKINSDYMAKSIADAKKFATESKRIAQDRETAISRLAEDGLRAMSEAEAGNDIISFLKAQSDNAVALKRASEDGRTEEQRRAADRAAQIEEERAAQAAKVAEAIGQIEQEKQAAILAFDEKRTALQASVESERVAIQERLQAAVSAYDQQEARETQQATRQSERQAIRDRQEQAAFDASIANIEQRKAAEMAMYTQIAARISAINSQIQANQQQQSSNSSSGNNSGTPFSSPFTVAPGSSYTIGSNSQAFADGGIVTKPTLALIGERGYPEAVVPMRNRSLSQDLNKYGMGSMSGGGINLTIPITMNNSVGDIATKSMLDNGLAQTLETVLYDALMPLLENALAGKSAA